MAKAKTTKTSILQAEIVWCSNELRALANEVREAKKPNFRGDVVWAPISALRARRAAMREKQLMHKVELLELEDGESTQVRPEDYTQEEWASMVLADAQSCSEADLQTYVSVWLDLHGYLMEIDEGGLMRLVRRAAS